MQNKRTYLNWIDDEALFDAVKFVYQQYKKALDKTSLKNIQRNTVDPFSLIFETALAPEIDMAAWIQIEAQRQLQKSLTNAIGVFHQKILGACDGWENLGRGHETGVDIKKKDGSVFAEIKNKHNTITGTRKFSALQALVELAKRNRGSTIYMVLIIPKNKKYYDDIWKVNQTSHERVRIITGNLFYNLVTNNTQALYELQSVLPKVIVDVINKEGEIKAEDIKAIRELDNLSPLKGDSDLLKMYEYFFTSAFG